MKNLQVGDMETQSDFEQGYFSPQLIGQLKPSPEPLVPYGTIWYDHLGRPYTYVVSTSSSVMAVNTPVTLTYDYPNRKIYAAPATTAGMSLDAVVPNYFTTGTGDKILGPVAALYNFYARLTFSDGVVAATQASALVLPPAPAAAAEKGIYRLELTVDTDGKTELNWVK